MTITRPPRTLGSLAELRARDLMTTDTLTVGEHESLASAWELLARAGYRVMPVMRSRRVVGVLDDQAMVRARSTKWLDGTPRTVGDAAAPARTVLEDTPLPVVLDRFQADGGACAVVVVDHRGTLQGVITPSAVIGLLTLLLAEHRS